MADIENKASGFAESEQSVLLSSLDLKVSPEALAKIQRLYHEAFQLYRAVALWNVRHREAPSAEVALLIAKPLRIYAGMDGRRLAERIEGLCHADKTEVKEAALAAETEKARGLAEAEQALYLPPLDLKVAQEVLVEIRRLYHEAFRLYGTLALWNIREYETPDAEQALGITRALRFEGNMQSRRLAEKIEGLCGANQQAP